MKLEEIRPVVYSVTPRKFSPEHRRPTSLRRCELLLIQEGGGDVRFGAHHAMPFGPGSVLLLPPECAYAIRPQSEAAMGLSISFDYVAGDAQSAPVFEDASCLNGPICLSGVPDIERDMLSMLNAFLRKEPYWQMRLSGGMQVIVAWIVQRALGGMHALISQVIDLVSKRYMEPLNNTDIASELGYHPNYVNAVFVRDMGMSLHQYLMRYRVEMASHLLLTTSLPISSIAEQVGFRHFSHFSNCFHRLTGVAPAAYRLEK
ncbi:MAG: helix-turn-helix domain-containing protein [Clostridia bacterium]|nr:helix-turn-helix domain-containing protein [Clostridia bacterium]